MKKITKVLVVTIFILFNIASLKYKTVQANTASSNIEVSNEKVILKEGQNTFNIDLVINNSGQGFSGGEVGLKLEGVSLEGVQYKLDNYSSAGPIKRDGITYIGFFNKDNIFNDGSTITLKLKYEGNSQRKIEILDSQITTRIDKFNIESNKDIKTKAVTVTREGHEGEVETPKDDKDEEVREFAPTNKVNTKDIVNEINSGDKDIIINLLQETTIDSEIFKAIKGKDKNVIINLLNADSSKIITYIFNGRDIIYDNISFDVGIDKSTNDEIQKKTKNKPVEFINFKHKGALPGLCKVKYKLLNNFTMDDKVNVYYYDGKVVEVNNDLSLFNDKEITFNINKGGQYFTTTTKIVDADVEKENDIKNKEELKIFNGWKYSTILLIIIVIILSSVIVYQRIEIKELKNK